MWNEFLAISSPIVVAFMAVAPLRVMSVLHPHFGTWMPWGRGDHLIIRIFSYVALLSRRGLAHSIGAALLVGVDFMAALDEILYHQILAWHHFYDRSTFDIALLSDGVLHIGELLAFAAGFFLLFDLCRRESLVSQFAQAGFVLGMGAFHWCSVWKSLCLLSP
jgi:hypothetical protein